VTVFSAQGCHDTSSLLTTSPTHFNWSLLPDIAFALTSSSTATQVIFNHFSKTFAGSFKVTVFLATAARLLDIAVEYFEMVGGWKANRGPLLADECVHLFSLVLLSYQAVTYPGISQKVLLEEESDDNV
jgi:hypothetical protein